MVAGSAVQRCKFNEHQQLLMAASDMLLKYIYMAESTILRTEKLAKNQGRQSAGENAMAKYTCIKQ
jgi:hypothetical protein